MKHSSIWLLSLLPLAVACAGGGAVPQSEMGPFGSQRGIREAESDATILAKATPVPVSSDLLYVANQDIANPAKAAINVYHHDASGDTAPIKIIAGSKTGLESPEQLSEDASGNLYVVNSGGNTPSILVFAHGATGNVAPIRKLSGPLTGFSSSAGPNNLEAMTVDQLTGKIFVTVGVSVGVEQDTSLLRFPPNATGNEAPYATSAAVAAVQVVQLASDSTGKNILASFENAQLCDCQSPGVLTMAKQFANGDPDELYRLNFGCGYSNCGGFSGLADDPASKTYLTSVNLLDYANSATIDRFPEKADSYNKPMSTVATGCFGSELALGYLRNIYATCGNAVYVYAPDASGTIKPLRVLRGAATRLDNPSGIYEGK